MKMPKGAATNPGSADPSLRGQESDAQSLDADESLGDCRGASRTLSKPEFDEPVP